MPGTGTMKALLLTDYKKLEIVETPRPEIRSDEVLVRVQACGICGSDVHGYDGTSGRRVPPLIMGHEASGTIEEVGSAVSVPAPGTRVAFDSTAFCGECSFCRSGRPNLCDNRTVLGVSCGAYRRHGAFAEYVAVPARSLCSLPADLPFEHAAMVEPVSVAAHAVGRTPPVAGGTALVLGAGMIGLLVIQSLRLAGWTRVIAVDLDVDRLNLATQLGADEAINASEQDVLKAVLDLTEGQGAEAVFEVVGISETVEPAVSAARKGGSVVLVGNLAPKVNLPLQAVVTRELSLYGSCAINGECAQSVEQIASGAIKVSALISATASLEEGPEWFERLYRAERGLMKVILKPQTS